MLMTQFDYSRVVYDENKSLRTADVLAVVKRNDEIEVLLIKRGSEPFLGHYATPGGFLEKNTDSGPGAAAVREVEEETGLKVLPPAEGFEEKRGAQFEVGRLQWLGYYDAPGRDPRFRTRTDTYWVGLSDTPAVEGADDAASAEFIALAPLLKRIKNGERVLAFDHDQYLLDLEEVIGAFS
jgi:8-oxo-dGTP diphosphatase